MTPEPTPAVEATAGAAGTADRRARVAHEDAVRAGRAHYVDPSTGYLVFTGPALAARGHCCGSGCRHCPYPPGQRRRCGRPGAG